MHVHHEELLCWQTCHDAPLTLGVIVEATEDCLMTDFVGTGQTFMVTCLRFDDEGVNIGLNENGDEEDFRTAYDGFRINELRPVKNGNHTP